MKTKHKLQRLEKIIDNLNKLSERLRYINENEIARVLDTQSLIIKQKLIMMKPKEVVEPSTQTGSNDFEYNTVVLSLSGGLDSTCLMLHYLGMGKKVHGISFYYGQKHAVELYKVRKNISFLQELGYPVTHQVVDLSTAFQYSQSSLHSNCKNSVPHDRYDSENQKSTVISNRNVIFSAIIYGIALDISKRDDCNVIIATGVHSNDSSIYPDCRPESVNMAKELYRISNWGSERVDYEAPFVNINKGQVLKAGLDAMQWFMGLDLNQVKQILGNTHSCYDPDEHGRSCGRCGTCQERRAAFKMNNMIDPIEYVTTEENLPPIETI